MSERFLTVDEQRCLRNALRRSGRLIPPTPESIAKPLTDEELSALIYDLDEIYRSRIRGEVS